jgi:phenylpyruvate C(3)-methyltransferase
MPQNSITHGFTMVYLVTVFEEIGAIARWCAGEAVDLAELAERQELELKMLKSSADYLTVYGYLERHEPSTYTATAQGAEVFGEWFYAFGAQSYAPLMENLLPLVRGEMSYGFGKDTYRNLYLNTKASGALSGKLVFPTIAAYLKRHDYKHLVDIGCGDGTFLELACRDFEGLQVAGVDQSSKVLHIARSRIAKAGFQDRATFLVGDLFRPREFASHPAVARADVATVFYILHEITANGTHALMEFLRVWRDTFGTEKLLMVTEIYRPRWDEMEKYRELRTLEVLLYHDLSGQGVLERGEWLAAYEQAGYEIVDNIRFADARRSHVETLVIRPRP